ncbi:MAG: ABC transporter ATP-binding protein [archaeon]
MAKKAQALIEAIDVKKDYLMEKVTVNALRGVSLTINKGDFAMIVGPSGSGKTTLMHILGALDHPTSGKVLIDGKDITKAEDWQLTLIRRKMVGFIFQTFNLIPTLTALENVMIPTEPMNIDENTLLKRSKYLLKVVGLEERMFHKPSELSGGQRQRVSIARSLINDPQIIMADEPTGNLDSITGLKIISLLRELNEKEGKTCVMVTHDQNLLKYATKRVYIVDGKIARIETGKHEETLSHEIP